jgi:hypothetical protein
MARPRTKNSKASYGNLGLSPEEDKKLIELLQNKDLTLSHVLRAMIRKWMEQNGVKI